MIVRVGGRTASATLIRENEHSVWVELFNGDVIKRSKDKHVLSYEDRPQEEVEPVKTGFWSRVIEFLTRQR